MANYFKLHSPSELIKNVRSVLNSETDDFVSLIFYSNNIQYPVVYDIKVKDLAPVKYGEELPHDEANMLESYAVDYINSIKAEHPELDSMVILAVHEDLWTAEKLAEIISDTSIYVDLNTLVAVASDLVTWSDITLCRKGYVDDTIITNHELFRLING